MKNITQSELSRVTKISRSHISLIENGRLRIQLDTLVVIAQGLRVSLSELFEDITFADIYETKKAILPPSKEKPLD